MFKPPIHHHQKRQIRSSYIDDPVPSKAPVVFPKTLLSLERTGLAQSLRAETLRLRSRHVLGPKTVRPTVRRSPPGRLGGVVGGQMGGQRLGLSEHSQGRASG